MEIAALSEEAAQLFVNCKSVVPLEFSCATLINQFSRQSSLVGIVHNIQIHYTVTAVVIIV